MENGYGVVLVTRSCFHLHTEYGKKQGFSHFLLGIEIYRFTLIPRDLQITHSKRTCNEKEKQFDFKKQFD